jgi:hypothetical protein
MHIWLANRSHSHGEIFRAPRPHAGPIRAEPDALEEIRHNLATP